MNKLEQTIDKYFDYLRSTGIHCHKNRPHRLHDGKYIEGEPFDYEIIDKECRFFDAKETTTDYVQCKAKEISQLDHLYAIERSGHKAFFLIYFYKYRKLTRISASEAKKALETQKQIHYRNCTEVKEITEV